MREMLVIHKCSLGNKYGPSNNKCSRSHSVGGTSDGHLESSM